MAGARVGSFEALRAFRAVLYKFAEAGNVALTDAEGEMQRIMGWLERDQQTYWQFQLRKRHEEVQRCKEAVRMKKLFKGADGRQGSAVDEEKALAVAMRKHQDAERKLKAVMYYSRKLPKDILMYKGSVQRLATALQSDVPTAGALLSRIVATLEAYTNIDAPAGGAGDRGRLVTSAVGSAVGMARGGEAAGKSQWSYLRSHTPNAQAKNSITASVPADVKTARLAVRELEALINVSQERALVDPQSRIVVAKDLAGSPRIYLERGDVAFPGDSGWYIGRADDAVGEAGGTFTVAELLAARGDLVDVLSLPRGFLVVIDGGGLLAVVGPGDDELWSPQLAQAAASDPAAAGAAEQASTTVQPASAGPNPAESAKAETPAS